MVVFMARRRNTNIILNFNKMIGSITHWMFRDLISSASNKLGIDIHPKLQMYIAYFLTGLFLLFIGVWHYLPWLPSISFPSFHIDWNIIIGIGTLVLGYLGWRAASDASRYTQEMIKDSRVARLNIRYTPEFGGFVISNIGKDTARNIRETSNLFNSVPTELLASIVPPTYDPRQAINRSVINLIILKTSIAPLSEIVVPFEYENSFGNKFTSEFLIKNLEAVTNPTIYRLYELTERRWLSL